MLASPQVTELLKEQEAARKQEMRNQEAGFGAYGWQVKPLRHAPMGWLGVGGKLMDWFAGGVVGFGVGSKLFRVASGWRRVD